MNSQEWYDRIGQRLREERQKRGLKQVDIAAILDVTGASVSRYERGTDHMKAHAYVLLRKEGLL